MNGQTSGLADDRSDVALLLAEVAGPAVPLGKQADPARRQMGHAATVRLRGKRIYLAVVNFIAYRVGMDREFVRVSHVERRSALFWASHLTSSLGTSPVAGV